MQTRHLTKDLAVSALGLGCMGMSEFYGERDDAESMKVLHRAADLGVTFFDTADIYGPHHNEELVGRFLAERRPDAVLATKFGIRRKGNSYERVIDNSPEYAREACEASLKRLGVDHIDLYYVHRIEQTRPIEEVVGTLGELRREGKIGQIGLCEVSAATLRRAHAEHPIAAVQTEYSLWTRHVEDEVLPACRELGVGFVPYSPLGRGFLTGSFKSESDIPAGDFRANLPRFTGENLQANVALAEAVQETARTKGCTPAQLALAWLLAQGDDIVPIPGTKRLKYLEDNIGAAEVSLSADEVRALTDASDRLPAVGERYPEEGMKGVNV